MKTEIIPTIEHARKVVESIDGALCNGAGSGKGQSVCVMQAIARALDLPASDDHVSSCVGDAVSAFNRRLNDCEWSTPESRASGMKQLGIASLGSNQLDQMKFGKLMFLRGTQKLLPFVFRKIADDADVKKEVADKYREHAALCEECVTIEDVKREADAAYAYASASAYASAYAYAYAYASASASAYASASASASASAYAYAYFRKAFGDDFLRMTAGIALECLKELKSPGCEFLDLCPAQ